MRSVYGFARLRSAFLITFFITATGTAMLLLPSVELSTESISSPASQKSFAMLEVTGRGNPFFNFQDVRQMSVTFLGADSATQALQSGQAVARALAAGDLDGNGTPDVVAGYAYGETGIVTVQRGNPDAFAPTDDSVFERLVQGYDPDSLLPDIQVYPLPVPADFLAVGNFDRRSAKDILFAAKGGGLYLMAGDGRGRFGEPEQIALPGSVTALAVGEFRAADGFTDVAVGVTGPGGEALLVFDGAEAFSTPLMQYQLDESASAIEFGGLDDDPFMDVAVAAGSEVLIVHGWGRKEQVVGASRAERIKVGADLRGLALGEFAWDRQGRSEIAALSADGTVHIVQNAKLDSRPFSEAEAAQRTRGKLRPQERISQDIESVKGWQPGRAAGWSESSNFSATSFERVSSASAKPLLRTNLSYRETDDLVLMGASQPKLEIVRPLAPSEKALSEVSAAGALASTTLDVKSAPVAVLTLPRKLNGVTDVVLLNSASTRPSIVPTPPGTTITVDRTDDPSGAALTAASACTAAGNDCSLRGALQFANLPQNDNTTISLPAGTYILSINGTSAGGCDGNSVGDLGANRTMSIIGAGAATTIIRQTGTGPANDGDRIMCMNEPFTVGLVYNFSGVTFVGGREGTAAGTGTALGGAGIIGGELNNSLTMTNVVMANNQETVSGSANLGGGAIQITGGNLIITNSTIGGTNAPGAYTDRSSTNTGNTQAGSGGGVTYTPSSPQHMGGMGTLTVTGSTFSRNTASGIGGGGADLLVFAFASPGGSGSGSASISTSTFSNNQALGTASGGGIIVESLATTIATTSFTSNSAGNRGGGIFVGGASLLLNGATPSITFTGNTATSGGTSVSTSSAVTVDGTNTTIGGSIEVNTLGSWTNNAGSTLAPTDVVVTGGTFNMNNSTMNVSGNLTIGPGPVVGSTFNGGTGTVNIQGNFVLNAGGAPATTLNAGTGTFNFNGTGSQSITNGTSITFFNLTDSNITQPLTANNSFAVGGSLNVNGTNAIFAPVAGAVISGAGTLTGTGTARVTRIAATADFSSQYTIANKTLTNLTAEYIGTAAQVLSPITFGPLKINNGNGVNITSGTSTVNGLLTLTTGALGVGNQTLVINNGSSVGAGSITSNPAGTVNYNQSSNGQNVRAFNYGNLTFSNFNKVLEPTGTIGISGVFTPGTATGHTITGSTVNFNGTGAQTLPAFNFNNLTISGARAANNVTLVNGGTIGVVGIFNPTATFSTGNYVVTNNTVNFNGSGGQTIPAFNYFNLTSSSSGARALASSGIIRVASVFTPGTNSYTITGSTVEYNGAAAQTLPSGFTTYNNLTLNNTAGTTGFAGLIVQGLLRVQAGTFTSSSTYKDVQIDSGATLAATTGSTINVSGNWTNNGTFTPNDGAVNFNGSSAQTVSGSSTSTFNNLTINNSSGVTLNADITINATLTLTAGALAIGSRTLTLNNALTITGGSFTSNANGTVNYNQSSNGQNVAPGNYGNLTFSNFQKILPGSGTVKIAGAFTTGAAGGHTITSSTVEYNGAAAQTIPSGFTTYNNLTLNNAAGVTGFAGLTVQGLLRIQQGTFTSSSTYNSVQIDNGATLSATAASTINIGGTWTNNGTFNANTGTVVFNGSSAQTISGTTTFNNLTINNASGVSLGTSTNVTVGGALTLTAGAFAVGTNSLTLDGAVTATGGSLTSGATGTVNYNQTSNGQAVLAANYGNLTFSNFTKTLPSSGTVRIAGTFTTGAAGGHTVTGSTVEFNGAAAQIIPSGFTTYNNLTINNASGASLGASTNVTVGATLTLTSGTLAIGANTLTLNGAVTATGGSLTSNANGTVNYNQTSNGQAVLAANYGNLTFSNFTKTLPSSGTVRIAGTFTTGAAGGHTVTGSTVEFNGTAAQTIPAGFNTFNNLTINNASGVSLGGSKTGVGILNLMNGNLDAGANTYELSASGSITRISGHVLGNLKKNFSATGTFTYQVGTANGYSPVTVNVTAGTGDLTVNAKQGPQPTLNAMKSLQRYWSLAGTGITVDMTFNYIDPTDIMGNEAAYRVIRVDGATAVIYDDSPPVSFVDEAANTINVQNISGFSDWTAGEATAPTAVEDVTLEAMGYDGGVYVHWRTGSEVANLGFNLYRDEGGSRVLVNRQVVAGSALVAGSTTVLSAGKSYRWWDGQAKASAQYWLEDIDLSGQSRLHGPFSAKQVGGLPPDRSQAALLSNVGNWQSGVTWPLAITAPLASDAAQRGPAAAQLSDQAAIKLAVKREGFYRVMAADLAAAGLDPRTDPARLQLFVEGRQLPIGVKTDNAGTLTAIEFYGVGLDTASTDARIYWLIAGQQPGLRFEQVGGGGRPTVGGSFLYTAERKDRTVYFSALRNGERENFFGAVVAGEPVDQSIMLRHIDTAAQGQATVEVSLQGVSLSEHRVWAYVNGAFAGELSFSGQEAATAKFQVAQSLLREGENQIRLVAQGGPADISLVNYVRVSYFHGFTAEDDVLRFTATGGQSVTIGGFSNRSVRVFDVTDADSAQEVKSRVEPQKEGGFAVTVSASGVGERRLFAVSDERAAGPDRVAANVPSSLRASTHAADLVIITHRDFFAAFDVLAKHRVGQGLKVELVDVEDIYDEFSFGHKSTQAVKDFLAFARTGWKTGPRYVLFAADMSYDPKNYLGLGDWDIAPGRLIDTGLMETASDDWFADFNGDGLAEMSVGRLPVRTAAEASAVVAKIIGYEQGRGSEEVLLVADSNDTFSFEGANAQLRGLIPAKLRVNEISRGRTDIATARAQLIEAALRGQKIINYTGHGSVDQWRGGLLTNEDAATLGDSERASIFVMMTCLNGYGVDPALDSLAEALLKTGRGGAVAVWASSGMTNPEEQAEMNRQLYRLIFGASGSQLTLGELTGRAKTAVSDRDIRATWTLIGDPTMKIR